MSPEDAIDGEVLADLAVEDLRKLGVTVVGDRRKANGDRELIPALPLSPLEQKKISHSPSP